MSILTKRSGGILFSLASLELAVSISSSTRSTFRPPEADFTYQLGNLPGGMNVGRLYFFNQDFAAPIPGLCCSPGKGW
jgi:hypothetical protein